MAAKPVEVEVSQYPNASKMSFRDWIAGQALPYCLTQNYGNEYGIFGPEHVLRASTKAYEIADAMVAQSEKPIP